KTSRFIRGPLPCDWFNRAMAIPSRSALCTALLIWFLVGARKQLSGIVFSTNNKQFYRGFLARGLCELEEAGLISADRKRGRAPRVTVLGIDKHFLQQFRKDLK